MFAPQLAAWAVGPVEIPDAVYQAALRHLLDGLGNAVAGARAGAALPAVTVALDLGGPPEATILGSRAKVSAVAAGLANGTLVHALDFDDTHAGGLVHSTSVVLPAAFAVGEQVGATGREVLDAAVVGYELACRVAAAAPNAFHTGGLHATMVAGVFSAAAVAARLLKLDPVTATHALGIAGSQAGGLLAFLAGGASTKQLHPGFASQAGIQAARLAAAGATGPENVFDGPHGVYDALAPAAKAKGAVDLDLLVRNLGSADPEHWETTKIGIKPWPTCQLAHVTMAAAHAALTEAGATAADIVALRAQVHPDSAAVVCATDRDLTRPLSGYAAKFSLPWSVAAILVDGAVGVDTYAQAHHLARAEITELAAKISWTLTEPTVVAADAAGEVEIDLADGRTVLGHLERSPGGGSNPLTSDELYTKFAGNVGSIAADLAVAVRALPEAADLTLLLALAAEAVEVDVHPLTVSIPAIPAQPEASA